MVVDYSIKEIQWVKGYCMYILYFRFLYCGQASVDTDNVKQLLYAAKKYAVKGLVDECLAFLESSVNVQNVCNILEQVCVLNNLFLHATCSFPI